MIILLVRSIYAALASLALAFEVAPWTREAFVKYGKTRSDLADKDAASKRPSRRQRSDAGNSNDNDNGNSRRQQAQRSTPVRGLLLWFSQQTVPKNWFWHFYLVGAAVGGMLALDLAGRALGQARPLVDLLSEAMSATDAWMPPGISKRAAVGSTGIGLGLAQSSHKTALLALSMYNAHVALRLKETVCDQPETSARMHIGQYGVGIIYYVVTPFAVVVDSYVMPGWTRPPAWAALAGIALYAYASVHQWRCHHILYKLRRRAMLQSSGYVVPEGDLFSFVACPHFLCEILIYLAIWTATGFQATTLVWTICWTVINLGITARETQQWYRRTFGSKYPRSRKALVPYMW